jgi:hypothetical protein
MSEGAAYRRITAARLVGKFPSLIERIERGQITLSSLVPLKDHLTSSTLDELVAAASGKSKRQVQELLARRAPKPDVPSLIRKLPSSSAPTTTSLTPSAPMAPEQIANIDVGHRADLYSVGAMMHYALSGQHAFDAPNLSALLYAIVHQPVPALSSIDPRIDPRLSAVVARAMHKEPSARFASAAEMRAALEPWSMKAPRLGMSASAPPSRRPSSIRRTTRSRTTRSRSTRPAL